MTNAMLPARQDCADIVDDIIRSRKSVRAFRPEPVKRSTIADILAVASCAPSNSNTQPWAVHVLAGAQKQALTAALLASHERGDLAPSQHFPEAMSTAFQARQADFGQRYYDALGIDRADAEARARQTAKNFSFFGAPIGLVFTIDDQLTKHSWADFGMFLQSVMVAATARGLATCPQVSFVRHAPVIAEVLHLPAGRTVVCGMSMGYPDVASNVNDLQMPRARVEEFAVFSGFDAE